MLLFAACRPVAAAQAATQDAVCIKRRHNNNKAKVRCEVAMQLILSRGFCILRLVHTMRHCHKPASVAYNNNYM